MATILDVFTKQILSYILSDSLKVDFVIETINKLVENHGISLHAKNMEYREYVQYYEYEKKVASINMDALLPYV